MEHHDHDHHAAPSATATFSTDTAGLPQAAPTAGGRARRRRHLRAAHRAGRQAARRRHRADARLQRLDPRPDAARPPGIGDHRPRPQRRRHSRRPSTGTGCGSTTATTACRTRRRRRSPIGGELHLPARFPDPGLYWYHPHIREDYGLDMGLYGNIVVDPADADYWPPATASSSSPSTTSSSRTARSRRSTSTARPTWPWAASATSCSPAARPTSISRSSAGEVVRFYFTNTANTPPLQRRAAGRAHEARRRRQRPLRTRDSSSRRSCSRRPSAPSSTCCSTHAGTVALEHRTPEHTYVLGTIAVAERAGDAVARRRVRGLRDERGVDGRTGSGSTPTRRRRRTRRSPSSLNAAPLRRPERRPVVYACPMHPEVIGDGARHAARSAA